MASLYKRYRKIVDPETGKKVKKEFANWWGRYVDADGIERRVPLSANKSVAQRKLKELVEQVRLEEVGLVSPAEKEAKRPILEHVDDFEKHHAASENTEQYAYEIIRKVKVIVEFCGWRRATQMRESDVESFLYDLRKVQGRSIQTSNNYLRAIKSFARWMVRNKRMLANPLEGLSMLNARTDRRHDRRPLSDEEFALLLRAAETGPPSSGLLGRDRAMLYLLAGWTGFRRGELGSLTLRSFNFDSNPATVTVAASYSKHRRKDVQILHPSLVDRFLEWIEMRKPKTDDEILFPISKKTCGVDRDTAQMIQFDLASARRFWIDAIDDPKEKRLAEESDFLKYKNREGLFADFHGLRHTFISNLGRAGVAPKTAQILARHSDLSLTMNIYTHVNQEDQIDAINSLPDLPGKKKEKDGDDMVCVPV